MVKKKTPARKTPAKKTKKTPAGPQVHVLLIGIDVYQGLTPLNGCVNDIDAIQDVLVRRVGIAPDRIKRYAAPHLDGTEDDRPRDPPTLAPTRDAILAALDALGSDAVGKDDRVFIYYSGHGVQLRVTGTNAVREALVPTDYKVFTERRHVFDWEIHERLRRIAARTPSVTVVLDCCSSAGATRDLAEPGARDRRIEDPEPIDLPTSAPAPTAERGIAAAVAGSAATCLVVAACLDDERARESPGDDGTQHGELTRALVAELTAVTDASALTDLRWNAIWRAVVARVSARNPAQHPWLSSNPRRRVFGGPPEAGDAGYNVTQDGATYHLDAGSLVGVTEGAEISVFPPDSEQSAAGAAGAAGPGLDPAVPAITLVPPGDWAAGRRLAEHYRAYEAPLRLAKNCVDLPATTLRLTLLACPDDVPASEAKSYAGPPLPAGARAPYELRAGDSETPGEGFVIRVENTSTEELYVTLFDCDSAGRVAIFGARVDVKPNGGQALFWNPEQLGARFDPTLPDTPDGRALGVERLVAIGTTNREADLGSLELDQTFAQALAGARAPVGNGTTEKWTAAVTTLRLSR